MHVEEVAREGLDDRVVAVDDHVDGEVGAGRGGDRPDVIVNGVTDRLGPCRTGIADPGRVVEDHDGLEPRQPGSDHLRPSGEAREEVRLDEARRDPEVGVDPFAVKPHRHTSAGGPAEAQARSVACVVVDDPDRVDDGAPEHLYELVRRVAAMRSGRDEQSHIGKVDDVGELLEQRGDDDVTRLCSRAVADGDRDGGAPADRTLPETLRQRRTGRGSA